LTLPELLLKLSEKFDYNKLVEYWKAKQNRDNFTHNVCVAFGMYQPQHGYLAWAVFDYMKNVEGFGQRKQVVINSNHVGSKDGNILNWWTSKDFGADKGNNVKVTGTIKDHGEFRGVKNTTLKNCKMEIVNVGTQS